MRGTEYAMALAADIVYNQRMFWGKRDYWFQPLCEQLGWDIKDHLKKRFRIVFFVFFFAIPIWFKIAQTI